MSADTSIEWTHRPGTRGKTWNPVRGCSKVSEGCRNCYAMGIAARFSGDNPKTGKPLAYKGLAVMKESGPAWTGKVVLVPEALSEPLRTKAPTTYFVNSMSDLFHEGLSDETIAAVFGVMAACPQHTFQVLTKRAERMARWFEWVSRDQDPGVTCAEYAAGQGAPITHAVVGAPWPLPNVWMGVSVEDQATLDQRAPELAKVPAVVRFWSYEPALGEIDPRPYLLVPRWVDWVIAGGESGRGARPMHPTWVRSLRNHLAEAGVPFFFKQWGAWAPGEKTEGPSWADTYQGKKIQPEQCRWMWPDGRTEPLGAGRYDREAVLMNRIGKKAAGRLLDGREWNQFPEVHA